MQYHRLLLPLDHCTLWYITVFKVVWNLIVRFTSTNPICVYHNQWRVLCNQCCQCLWIVHSSFALWLSQMFIFCSMIYLKYCWNIKYIYVRNLQFLYNDGHFFPFLLVGFFFNKQNWGKRRVWRYQRVIRTVYQRRTDNTMAKKYKKKNNDLQRIHITRTPLTIGVELRCSGRVSSSCSTSCYSSNKPGDMLWMREWSESVYDKWNISVVICDTYIA